MRGCGHSRKVRAMAAVVCLIADPERAPLEHALVAELRRALGGRERWLAEAEACEILVERGGRQEILARIGAAAPEPPLDRAVVAAEGRRGTVSRASRIHPISQGRRTRRPGVALLVLCSPGLCGGARGHPRHRAERGDADPV